MKMFFRRLTAVMLAFVLFAGSLTMKPAHAKSTDELPIQFGVMTDIHYYPESFVNTSSEKYLQDAYCRMKLMGETPAILKATLETIAVRKEQGTFNMSSLLVAGDMTFAGEITGHLEIATLFRAFEARTGIQVFVINGNHDVNNYNAVNYAVSDVDDPAQITSPEEFKEIYTDFGYTQADSVYTPATGKAGMLSYAVSLPGGYRLIAIDACIYSADVTEDGLDKKDGGMNMTPELSAWVLAQTQNAANSGEKVIGMVHHSLLPHFELESLVSEDDMLKDYESFAYSLADAGMHFVFTGHVHASDTASIISADNNIIYDIETGALANIPNTYREVEFSKGLRAEQTSCRLNNVPCDAECRVDLSGVSDKYGLIEKPFSEHYCMPMLYGGSVDLGIRNDVAELFKKAFLPDVNETIADFLPNGLAGLLKDNGIDLGKEFVRTSPALKAALNSFQLTPQAFSQFLSAVVKQVDDKYFLNTAHTDELICAAVARLTHYEIAKGNSATEFGKILMLGLEYHSVGDEDPRNNPEIQITAAALRTQAGADRFVGELIDILLNDVIFNDILPSITLDDLDMLLPAGVMASLRSIAGGDLSVGGILDKILDNAANRLNLLPFVHVESGRDFVKALVYTAGYPYLGADQRLKMANALADIIDSFTTDNDPAFLGDSMVTLQSGKMIIEPSAANYRLPADIEAVKGSAADETVITWYTIQGIEGSDIEITPLPAEARIQTDLKAVKKTVKDFDFSLMKIEIDRTLLKHTLRISGLKNGVEYTFRVGDNARGLMGGFQTLLRRANGDIELNRADDGNIFFKNLTDFFAAVIDFFKSLKTILSLLT